MQDLLNQITKDIEYLRGEAWHLRANAHPESCNAGAAKSFDAIADRIEKLRAIATKGGDGK